VRLAKFVPAFLLNEQRAALPKAEIKRLQRTPRYSPVQTRLFGVPIRSNDACTLLADIQGILNKGVYKFNAERKSPVIIDCGANIGISVVYFKRLYPQAKIVAFEPDPVLFTLLEHNIASFQFDKVDLIQKAVWIDGNGVNFRPEGGHSGAIVVNDIAKNDGNTITAGSIRLKDVLQSFSTIDLLKMDIEGAENEVLLDCTRVLDRCEHVFVEYHSRKNQPQKLHTILELFSESGYRYHVQEAFCRTQPFIDRTCLVGMDLQLNLFFFKAD
jgi:FkbM family methyltransferase